MDCITPKGTINYVILVDVIDNVSVLLEWTLPCLYMYIVQGVASWSVFSGGGAFNLESGHKSNVCHQ